MTAASSRRPWIWRSNSATGKAPRRANNRRARRGKLYGVGLASVIEVAGGPAAAPFEEAMEIRFDATGGATFLLGTHSHGQGHETAFRQLAHHFLGLSFDQVTLIYGDTDKVFHGRGTFGSRSLSVGGGALKLAADQDHRKRQEDRRASARSRRRSTSNSPTANSRYPAPTSRST